MQQPIGTDQIAVVIDGPSAIVATRQPLPHPGKRLAFQVPYYAIWEIAATY